MLAITTLVKNRAWVLPRFLACLEELDYPKGDSNEYTKYEGTGGIQISNALRKLWLTIKLRSLEIIFTGSLTRESRVMIYRSIQERVPKIAPFLKYDPNPYLVVYDGRLVWLYDAYTTTNRFPYATPYKDGYNYIRNSVKVTIDAGSKADAALIASELPGGPEATSRRGYGVIRMRLRRSEQMEDILSILEAAVRRHNLAWARLRVGDEEWMFRGRNGNGRGH